MFLISDKHKFIFFHIPRTGGTSVEHVLRPYSNFLYRHDIIYNFFASYIHEQPKLSFFQSHTKAINVQEKISQKRYDSYTKFAVCRNPFDWLASVYFFSLKSIKENKENFKELHSVVQDSEDFKAFCKKICETNNSGFQKLFVTNNDKELIVDHIIHFENLDEGFNKIAKVLDLEIKLQKINSSDRKQKWQSLYTPEILEMVYQSYKEDFIFFNYSLDETFHNNTNV